MSAPILATKLYVPPTRPRVVLRPRLIGRLNQGFPRRLTLVSAPAGFGAETGHVYLMLTVVMWFAAAVVVLVYGSRNLSRRPRQELAAPGRARIGPGD